MNRVKAYVLVFGVTGASATLFHHYPWIFPVVIIGGVILIVLVLISESLAGFFKSESEK